MQTPYIFGPVALSSLERCAFYLGKDVGKGRVNGINNDSPEQRRARRAIMGWLMDISSGIQYHCNREFIIQSRIQYFDVKNLRMEFFPSAVPIVSITEVANDPLAQFDGSEWILSDTDYHYSQTARSLVMLFNSLMYGDRTLRVTYLGGYAYHATQSTMTLTGVTGPLNIVAGRYAYGGASESIAKVISYNDTTKVIVLDNLCGAFISGEGLTFQPDVYSQDIASTGATIASIDKQSLVEAFPDISRAVEIELRYMEKHESDFENVSDGGKAGAVRRQAQGKDDAPVTLQLETQARLMSHRRYLMGS